MQDHIRRPSTSVYMALAVNIALLSVLAWHIACEAVPQTLIDFHTATEIGSKAIALSVLLPYAVLLVFLVVSGRRSVFRWRTAGFILGAVLGYAIAVIAWGLYISRDFFPT